MGETFCLGNGTKVCLPVGKAAEMDKPEGVVTISVSATLYARLRAAEAVCEELEGSMTCPLCGAHGDGNNLDYNHRDECPLVRTKWLELREKK